MWVAKPPEPIKNNVFQEIDVKNSRGKRVEPPFSQNGDHHLKCFLPCFARSGQIHGTTLSTLFLTRLKRFWRFIGWPQDILETLPRSNPLKFQCFCGSFWENNIIHLETPVFLILFGRLRNPRRTPSASLLSLFVRSGQIHGTTLSTLFLSRFKRFWRFIGWPQDLQNF